ncbi:uncharacterized protein LOC144341898, partial [Saccoglossus kowalevskii]
RLYGVNAPVLWIGANDRTTEGGWEWSDGSAFAYFNWAPEEPNNVDGEHCVELVVSDGNWNDHKCDRTIGYICKNKGVLVDHFNVHHDAALDGQDTLHLENVYPEDCATRCLEELSFVCESFDYDKVNLACNLSSYDQHTCDCLKTDYPDNPYDYYEVVSRPTPDPTTTAAPGTRCSYSWHGFGSECYFLQTVRMGWADARDSCGRMDGDLVSIHDGAENDYVLSLIHASCEDSHFLSSEDDYTYEYVAASPGVSRTDFEVKASNDALIGLSEEGQDMPDMYEIVIGGNKNTQSFIRRCMLCENEVVEETPDILSADEFRAFYVTWYDGYIKVGKRSEEPFMEWQDPDPLPVNYVGYTTGWGSEGEFQLCSEHENS